MTVSFTRDDFRKFSSEENFQKIVDIKTVPGLLAHMKQYAGLPSVRKNDGSFAPYEELLSISAPSPRF